MYFKQIVHFHFIFLLGGANYGFIIQDHEF